MKSDNSGSHLIDLIQGDEDGLQETKHMHPQLMELLRGIHALKPSAVQIHDTHSKDPIQQPAGQVDCSLLASDLRRWTSMVVPVESSSRTVSFPQLWVKLCTAFDTLYSSSQLASGRLLSSSLCKALNCSNSPDKVIVLSTFRRVAPRCNSQHLWMCSVKCVVGLVENTLTSMLWCIWLSVD